MADGNMFGRIAGSVLAGAAGFAIGFYSGFFLILGAWGLDANEIAFVFIAGSLGVLGASLAIASTVSRARRWVAAGTTGALGLVLLLVLFATNSDLGAMAVGAVVLVGLAASLVRTGAMDSVPT